MKKVLSLFFVSSLLIGCNNGNKELKEYLSAADSVAINYFKGDGTMDTVMSVKIIRDKKTVEQLAVYISEDAESKMKQCGYDGSLHFFKNNIVTQDVDFRMNDNECMFFTAKFNGNVLQTNLSPDAKQLLESVRK